MSYLNLPLLVRGRSIQDKYAFPPEIYEARYKAVKKIAEDLNLEGIIVFSGALLRGSVGYLTRNRSSTSNTMMIVTKDAGAVMFTPLDERAIKGMKRRLPSFLNLVSVGFSLMSDDRVGGPTIDYLKNNGLLKGKWGIVNSDSMPQSAYQGLIAGGLDMVDVTDDFDAMKAIKDSNELYPISLASLLAQRAVFDFIRLADTGVSPIELSAQLERGLRINGVEHPSILISRGPETSFTIVDDTPLEKGEMISVFADIQFLHYHGAYAATAVVEGGNMEQSNLIAKAKSLLDKTVGDIATTKNASFGHKSIDAFGSYMLVNSIGIELVDAPLWDGRVLDIKPGMALNITVNLCDPNAGSAVCSRTAVVTESGLAILNDFGPQ